MFKKDYFFRYGDIDRNHNIKISAIIDVLQDVSINHSDNMGYSQEKLDSMQIAWLLSGWRIKILNPIDHRNAVIANTGIINANKFEAVRKYEITQDGECKIIATANWFTVNTTKKKLTRIPEEMQDYYKNILECNNDLPFMKLKSRQDLTQMWQTKAQRRDIDTNNHVNNVKSAEILLDFLPEDADISELQINYKKEIYMDEIINICGVKIDNGYFGELKNENDETCVMINVITK